MAASQSLPTACAWQPRAGLAGAEVSPGSRGVTPRCEPTCWRYMFHPRQLICVPSSRPGVASKYSTACSCGIHLNGSLVGSNRSFTGPSVATLSATMASGSARFTSLSRGRRTRRDRGLGLTPVLPESSRNRECPSLVWRSSRERLRYRASPCVLGEHRAEDNDELVTHSPSREPLAVERAL